MVETRKAMKQVQGGNEVQEERRQKYAALYQQYQQHIQQMQQQRDELYEEGEEDLNRYDPNGEQYKNFFEMEW